MTHHVDLWTPYQQTGVVESKRYSEVTGAKLNIEQEEKSKKYIQRAWCRFFGLR